MTQRESKTRRWSRCGWHCGLKGTALASPRWKEDYTIQVAEINLAPEWLKATPPLLCCCFLCFPNYDHLLITTQVWALRDDEALNTHKHTHTHTQAQAPATEQPKSNDYGSDEYPIPMIRIYLSKHWFLDKQTTGVVWLVFCCTIINDSDTAYRYRF